MSYLSKTKLSKCYYCNEEMKDENLKVHCLTKHNAAKHVAVEVSVVETVGWFIFSIANWCWRIIIRICWSENPWRPKSKSIKSLDSKDIIKDFLYRYINLYSGVDIAEQEIEISENDPKLIHADRILKNLDPVHKNSEKHLFIYWRA